MIQKCQKRAQITSIRQRRLVKIVAIVELFLPPSAWLGLSCALLLGIMASPASAQEQVGNRQMPVTGPLTLERVVYKGRTALHVRAEGGMTGEDRLVHLPAPKFGNGTIEGYFSGQPVSSASAGARGFVGIAFRVHPDITRYEAFYIRPSNGRASDQLRRNRSTQYISHPEFTWERLRSESPGLYESYADMEAGHWIHFRIEVEDDRAMLFLNKATQPSLIVNDLKQTTEIAGGVALWVGPETDAYFADVQVTHRRSGAVREHFLSNEPGKAGR